MDTTWELLTDLLGCASDNLSTPVCREFVHPGPEAPWDTCEVNAMTGADGQLWVAHVNSTAGWPPAAIATEPSSCPVQDTATFEVGIVRCAQGKITDNGRPPKPELVTADAEQQSIDRFEIRQAIACCFAAEPRDIVLQDWQATSPLGGCVGGVWTVLVRIGGCGCQHYGQGL